MRLAHSLLLGIVVALAACSDPASTEPHDLYGSWVEHQPLQPTGSMDRIFEFKSTGKLTFIVNVYGIYSQSATLSAYTRTTGSFRIEDNRLVLQAEEMETWDGGHSNPGPWFSEFQGSLLGDCTFEISDGELTLRYTSYPADAPVATVMRLRRIP